MWQQFSVILRTRRLTAENVAARSPSPPASSCRRRRAASPATEQQPGRGWSGFSLGLQKSNSNYEKIESTGIMKLCRNLVLCGQGAPQNSMLPAAAHFIWISRRTRTKQQHLCKRISNSNKWSWWGFVSPRSKPFSQSSKGRIFLPITGFQQQNVGLVCMNSFSGYPVDTRM